MRHPLVALCAVALLAGCANPFGSPSQPVATECAYPEDTAGSGVDVPGQQPSTATVHVTLHTTSGNIPLTLEPSKAPCTVNAITTLAKQGFFDNTICHRLTTQGIYVLQCGDPTGTGSGGPGFSFKDEYPINQSNSTGLYKAGTLAMANHGPNTNGSQFFLTYKDSKLQPNYTIFGQVDEAGLEVLRTIADSGTDTGQPDGHPATDVVIQSVSVS